MNSEASDERGASDREVVADRAEPFIVLGFEFNRDEDLPSFVLSESSEAAKLDWELVHATSRSKGYQLNSFRYFVPTLLKAFRKGREDELEAARRVMKFVHDWAQTYRYDLEDPLGGSLDNKFAWYDMAVGMRAGMIGYLLGVMDAADFPAAHRESLLRTAGDHAAYLERKDLWSWHSNHGYYQSLGLFAMVAQAPDAFGEDAERLRAVAVERTLWYLNSAVSGDGVHLEHSPLYHLFIYRSVAEAIPWLDADRPGEADIAEMFSRMQDALAATFMPNGTMVPFGDSRLARIEQELSYSEAALTTLTASLGAQYRRVVPTDAPAPDPFEQRFDARETGLIIRKSWDGVTNSYFAQAAQNHSAVHKQVDDMTIYWSENDLPILSDPGRYGYEGQTEDGSELRNRGYLYSHPSRIYVESAQAHNVVEIDAQSDNRRRTPHYQSAVIGVGGDADTLITQCQRLREQLVGHNRVAIHRPGRFLLVIDALADTLERPHSFTQWWNLFPAWRLAGNAGRTMRATGHEGWVAEYIDTLDAKEASTVQRLAKHFRAPDHEVGLSWAATRDLDWSSKLGARGADDRLEGWASIVPMVLRPAPALALSTKEPTPSITVGMLLSVVGPDVKTPLLELVSHNDERVEFRIGGDGPEATHWTLERGDAELRVIETDAAGNTLSRHILPHDPVRRLVQSDSLIKARAHRELGSDPQTVFDHYEEACEPAWADAAIEAAAYASEQEDADRELAYLAAAAAAGDGNGAMLLGQALMGSAETPEEFARVEALLIKGAQSRIRTAHVHLGQLYEMEGPLANPSKAEASYRQGALMGHPSAGAGLGRLLLAQGRAEEALPWLAAGAEAGNTVAAFSLGELYRKGEHVKADPARALAHYRQAMAGGSRNAFLLASRLLDDPAQDFHDPVEARKLLESAADKGVANAIFELGRAEMDAGKFESGLARINAAAKAGSRAAIQFRDKLKRQIGD